MDKKDFRRIINDFSELVKLNVKDIKFIILFGSYSKNQESEHSDIDIAVVVNKTKKSIFELEGELYKLRRGVDSRIEPIVIDINKDPSNFLDEILRTGQIIYKKTA